MERERVYNQGRGSVWGLQAPPRGFGSRSNPGREVGEEGVGRSATCNCMHVRTAEGGGGGGCGKAYDVYVRTCKDCCMVPAVRDWAIGVPKPFTLVEPATRAGLERLGGVERVTNSW